MKEFICFAIIAALLTVTHCTSYILGQHNMFEKISEATSADMVIRTIDSITKDNGEKADLCALAIWHRKQMEKCL